MTPPRRRTKSGGINALEQNIMDSPDGNPRVDPDEIRVVS